ncbi:MAG: S8 family serine peptidase [Opitutales bacterium]|jgi:subtilisin family serine protease|nr:S8 family serine peptidase [Opitutales bacterium]MDP4882622.1 S8 family serine peptidase [Opitutales bacterium]
MKFVRLLLVLCALAIFGGLLGFLLSFLLSKDEAEPEVAEVQAPREVTGVKAPKALQDYSLPTTFEEGEIQIDYPASTIEGELVLQFTSRAEYAAYLKALLASGNSPMGQIDELMVVRIDPRSLGAVNLDDFDVTADFSYEVMQPLPPVEFSPEALASLQGFGLTARQIAGGPVDGDGSGVIVGILDSGIQAHAQFDDVYIVHIDLAGGGVDGAGAAHGTSVASIITGSEGIAPAAELFVVRVLNDEGMGNSYHLAEGIVQATDMGVKIINMSLAVYQDSALLRQAVSYATQKGVILVAAAGNDGYDRMPYPAAYADVIAVTAIDANGRHAVFPNQSSEIDIAAPGVAVLTAKEDLGTTLFTGTSAAAPFVSGTLAAMLSADSDRTPKQTVELLKRYLNDAGAVGEDPAYGDGVIDWNRLRERGTTGILDLALADIYLDSAALPGTTMPIEVTVQNRGTKWSSDAVLEVMINDAEPVSFTVGSIGPGLTTTRKVYSEVPSKEGGETLSIAARVLPEKLESDVRLENNLKAVFFQAK